MSILCSNYEVYQEKMSKHKHLSELAESSHAVNVDISNKMKYYDMLNQESKWGCKWGGGGGGDSANHPCLQLRGKLNCEGRSST